MGRSRSLHIDVVYRASPDSVLGELSRGMLRSGDWSPAAVISDDLVDFKEDVLGYAGLYGSTIDHLCEVNALLVRLSDRHLTENFIFTGNNDADEITRNVCFPCCEFLQCDDITWHDDWCK